MRRIAAMIAAVLVFGPVLLLLVIWVLPRPMAPLSPGVTLYVPPSPAPTERYAPKPSGGHIISPSLTATAAVVEPTATARAKATLAVRQSAVAAYWTQIADRDVLATRTGQSR